jgi:glyoxylase-like metal-dependent hydrolase (beta-lactamase superfamily II)
MKRTLILIGVVLLVVVLMVAAAVAAAFTGRKAIADGMEVNGTRIVADGIVSVAMFPVGPGAVALIDAGNDAEGKAVIAELSRRGLTPDAVSVILLTHGHADHIAAIGRFPKAQVMALEDEVRLVEGREGAKGPLLRLMPVRPTGISVARPLHDGETVMLGDVAVRVFAVPGHTAGSAAYLVRGALFVGDSADATSDDALQGAPWIFSDSQAENRASLVRLNDRLKREGTTVMAIIPAHSGVLSDGLAQLDRFAHEQSD